MPPRTRKAAEPAPVEAPAEAVEESPIVQTTTAEVVEENTSRRLPVPNPGGQGKAVDALQVALGVEPTGTYDDATAREVRRWQIRRGHSPTGVVTDRQWREIGPQ